MKTKFFLVEILCLAVLIVKGQNNVPPFTIESVSFTPPAYTGTGNSIKQTAAGKDASLREYLDNNFEFPGDAEKNYVQGTAVVRFVVTAQGKLTDFKIINSVWWSIDEELIRVLKNTSGMWKPGCQNDVPVDMEKEVAMMFVASNANRENPELYFANLAKDNFTKGTQLFLGKNNARKALIYFDNCVKYLPYETASLMVRGLCKYQLGDKEGAFSDWNRINAIGRYDMSEYIEEFRGMKGFAEMINTLGIN